MKQRRGVAAMGTTASCTRRISCTGLGSPRTRRSLGSGCPCPYGRRSAQKFAKKTTSRSVPAPLVCGRAAVKHATRRDGAPLRSTSGGKSALKLETLPPAATSAGKGGQVVADGLGGGFALGSVLSPLSFCFRACV